MENLLNLGLWIVAGMFAYILKYMKRIVYIGEASKATLRYMILERCERLIERGYTTTEDIEELEEMNEPYRALGGNGTAKLMLAKVENLPIKKNR